MAVLSGCSRNDAKNQPASNRVVLYCSVDDVYARPIIRDLEKKTGLRIQTVFDTEAAKTAGLASRIRSEKNRPLGDVFWSSALLQTLLLDREGLLQRYQSPASKDIPTPFRDMSGAWTGMGVRTRAIVYHASLKAPPSSLQDLLQPRFKGKVGISNPQFGTASDWAAALAVRWGESQAMEYFTALKQNGVRVLPGNSVVAERVARGELLAGVTDSDDFLAQAKKSDQIRRATTSRAAAQFDSLLLPGSVAMIAGSPHPEAARRLIDALLSVETEKQLVQRMPGVLPLRGSLPATQQAVTATEDPRFGSPDDTARWIASWNKIREPLATLLLTD